MKKSTNKLAFKSQLYLSWKNFLDRKWRNGLIAFATSIGFTGILISFGLGNAIVSMINSDTANLPSQVQISLNSQFASGTTLNDSDLDFVRKAAGDAVMKHLEAPFSITMTKLSLSDSGKMAELDPSQTYPNYAQVVSLYEDTTISVDANDTSCVLAGDLYTDNQEEGLTIPETLIHDWNEANGTDYTAADFIGQTVEVEMTEQTAEGSQTATVTTTIIRILADEAAEANSFMAPSQMEKVLDEVGFQKVVPYLILEMEDASQTTEVISSIKENNRYTVLSQEAILDTVITFIRIIQGLLVVLSAQAILVSMVMIGVILYINIMERSREIGVMKAVGYLTRDVRSIFVTEALLITFLALGIALVFSSGTGALANAIVRSYYPSINSVFALNGTSILVVTLLALFMGLISAYFPTRKVGKLDPVEALRYE